MKLFSDVKVMLRDDGNMFPMITSNEIPGVCEESGPNNWRNALLYIQQNAMDLAFLF